jgi:hypothetical protein
MARRPSKGTYMLDDPAENTPGSEGRKHEDAMYEEPFDEADLNTEEAERGITQFVTSADELPGPPVEKLAQDVAGLMQATRRDLETLMERVPHNKVLATQLFLNQQARGLHDGDPEQRKLYAASTLLSELVVRGAHR